MLEIVWHGRGGQGAFTAAKLLGAAAAGHDGLHALAFPSFGPERRGAPMRAFTKIDSVPVADRSVPTRADIVVYLDETLLDEGWRGECRTRVAGETDGASAGVAAGEAGGASADAAGEVAGAGGAGKAGGAAEVPATIVLVNHGEAGRTPEGLLCLPASALAAETLGRDIPNTAFLGAICELSDMLSIDDALRAIDELMPPRLRESNKEVVARAAKLARELAHAAAPAIPSLFTAGGAASQTKAAQGETAQPAATAHVRHEALDYTAIAQTTCFPSGYLDHDNAGWRSVRPVVDEAACVGCLHCWVQCPDACVIRRDDDAPSANARAGAGAGAHIGDHREERGEGADGRGDAAAPHGAARVPRTPVAIDYALCKGCGICARACPVDAIAMVGEHEREEEAA